MHQKGPISYHLINQKSVTSWIPHHTDHIISDKTFVPQRWSTILLISSKLDLGGQTDMIIIAVIINKWKMIVVIIKMIG